MVSKLPTLLPPTNSSSNSVMIITLETIEIIIIINNMINNDIKLPLLLEMGTAVVSSILLRTATTKVSHPQILSVSPLAPIPIIIIIVMLLMMIVLTLPTSILRTTTTTKW